MIRIDPHRKQSAMHIMPGLSGYSVLRQEKGAGGGFSEKATAHNSLAGCHVSWLTATQLSQNAELAHNDQDD